MKDESLLRSYLLNSFSILIANFAIDAFISQR